MSDTTASLQRKIANAGDLRSVVRAMKGLAASSIGQYEKSVRALDDYYRTVELGLGACLRKDKLALLERPKGKPEADATGAARSSAVRVPTDTTIGIVVFGSDQGLVGQFNEVVVAQAMKMIATVRDKPEIWAVGERVHARLVDAGLSQAKLFGVPSSVKTIAPLVGQILIEEEALHSQRKGHAIELHLFYNHPTSGSGYAPIHQRLLPLDDEWYRGLIKRPWPTKTVPEVMSDAADTLRALIREFLFISIFRASANSLASENASRLAAMERADKNIDNVVENLNGTFHRLRQSSIDEELFDVVSGFEALSKEAKS